MIPERGVSYYGVAYANHAARDYREMAIHGCNAILLAVSEFDWWFWRRGVARLIEAAHDQGLRAYVDLWGWGKTLAGEPPSIFLMRNPEHRQLSSQGKTYHASCLNHLGFRDFLKDSIREMAEETDVDGLFWDEPHYANWHDPDWACRCQTCRRLYREETGHEMPRELTPEVVSFREDRALEFLGELSSFVKQTDPGIQVTTCLLPTQSPLIGITDWRRVAEMDDVDVLGTDPYWYHHGMGREDGLRYFREMGARVIRLAEEKGKRSQLWLQAFRVPGGREDELMEAADIADQLGVDSLFAWPYRGGWGSILESGNPARIWAALGEAFRAVGS